MDLQHGALTVTAIGGAVGTLYGGYRVLWPRMWRAWANRSKVRVEAALARIEQSSATAANERSSVARVVEELKHDFALFRAEISAFVAADPDVATFVASPQGLLTEASKTYLRWTGRSFADLERWGWVNVIHPQDQAKVRSEWDAAVRDQRQSVMRFRMIGADGGYFEVVATATPIPDGAVTCEKFVGHIRRFDLP